MKNIIKRILREERQFDSNYLERVSRRIEPPYFYNMKEQYGITKTEDQLVVLKYFYGDDIRIDGRNIYDSNRNIIYYEESSGYWEKYEYLSNGNVYFENSIDSDDEIIDNR